MIGPRITLLVSDIDGTLVTPDKTLTAPVREAVASLRTLGVAFSVISSRPPRGMRAIQQALGIDLPFAAFNGGTIVAADGAILEAHRLASAAAERALTLLAAHGVDAWVFADGEWFLCSLDNDRVPLERRTVGFDPVQVAGFGPVLDRIDKIVGVSDDRPRLAALEAEARQALGAHASVERSQPYYLDITHPRANKGDGVRALARLAGASMANTAVIGDMTNDVAMFRVAGFSIAMGQAAPEVQAAATVLTSANTEEGVAAAIRLFIGPRATAAAPVLVIMGVSGSGKTTVGQALAARLGWTFTEGDDFHPTANIAKMKAGHPLDDQDRAPWLAAIGRWIDDRAAAGAPAVISCSALKAAYRASLTGGRPQVCVVQLAVTKALVAERLAGREGHFMPASLQASQFAALEPPAPAEGVLSVDAAQSVEAQVGEIIDRLALA